MDKSGKRATVAHLKMDWRHTLFGILTLGLLPQAVLAAASPNDPTITLSDSIYYEQFSPADPLPPGQAIYTSEVTIPAARQMSHCDGITSTRNTLCIGPYTGEANRYLHN